MFMPNSPSPPSATTSSIGEHQGTQRSRRAQTQPSVAVSAGSALAVGGHTPGGADPVDGSRRGGSVRLLGAPETKWGGLNDLRRTIAQLDAFLNTRRRAARIRRSRV